MSFVNLRRAISFGKVYLIIAIAISILVSVELIVVSHVKVTGAGAAAASLVSILPALILPLFTVIGSFGGLMIFVSDKDKGVYEYLIAYGVNPSKIFWSIVLAIAGLVSIVLAISIPINFGLSLAFGKVSLEYTELLLLYVIPISYATSIFMGMVGMIWSSLAVRRTGINSPVGPVSIIGIIPILVILFVSVALGPTNSIYFAAAVSIALYVLVGVMVRISGSKMVRERFLSSA